MPHIRSLEKSRGTKNHAVCLELLACDSRHVRHVSAVNFSIESPGSNGDESRNVTRVVLCSIPAACVVDSRDLKIRGDLSRLINIRDCSTINSLLGHVFFHIIQYISPVITVAYVT